ncbi:uncharacterized protein K02A2.6-like [Ylistrum balloti]|uniref:uncharacterized protein K02A2.6-like n=1 Tax=Ylistrum balloti TaxID=509963 RepID=UPI002905E07B|nr:uncharacterized protein K02A2.6-like [Ylistrum balloti]
MFLADTLSRAFLKETNEDLIPDLTVNEVHLLQYLPVSPEKYRKFQQTTAEDEELKVLQDIVLKGWPDTKEQVPVSARHYWSCRDEISSVDGLLFKNHKLVVPKPMRKEMLKTIHNSHMGIVKCKSRAREVMYWPGMSTEVEETVAKCSTCAQHLARNPKEPLTETEIPDRPWSVVSADIFEFKGHNYMVTVDNFSKWPEVAKLDNLSSNNTIHYLKSQFSRNGIVDKLITDNGPQFSSDAFATFAKEYGFIHPTSSPHYAQSNGQAERIVQTVKNLIKKASDPYLALLAYRNTTMEEIGLSPAQMFYGRRLKTDLPTTYPLLTSQEVSNGQEIKKRLKLRQSKHKMFFDRHSGPELKPLNTGDKVIMNHNNSWIPATVSGKHKNPKSYILENSNGRKYRRNRKHIRPTKADIQIRTEEPSMEPPPLTTFDTPEKASTETVLVDKPNSVRQSSEQLISPKPNFEPSLQKCTRSGRVVVPPRKLCDYVS